MKLKLFALILIALIGCNSKTSEKDRCEAKYSYVDKISGDTIIGGENRGQIKNDIKGRDILSKITLDSLRKKVVVSADLYAKSITKYIESPTEENKRVMDQLLKTTNKMDEMRKKLEKENLK
jgi:hypothetical protein